MEDVILGGHALKLEAILDQNAFALADLGASLLGLENQQEQNNGRATTKAKHAKN